MGVAPGIPTEFWYFPGQDFCLDMKEYTTLILSTADVPLVHSVSYGYQGMFLEQVPPDHTLFLTAHTCFGCVAPYSLFISIWTW